MSGEQQPPNLGDVIRQHVSQRRQEQARHVARMFGEQPGDDDAAQPDGEQAPDDDGVA